MNGVTVFGDDYDTLDGTCTRDYIHLSGLAATHVVVLSELEAGGASRVLNCSYGRGFSERELLDAVQAEAGTTLDIRRDAGRAGDPLVLIADPSRLRAASRWSPRHDDLGFIVRSALAWESTSESAQPPRQMAWGWGLTVSHMCDTVGPNQPEDAVQCRRAREARCRGR